jgi:NAD(P)-dependent dehydrogenase (short-subunit alcohol dehydrogenase family)
VGPGLGAALARRFSRDGFSVGLVARHPEFIERLAREISATGQSAASVVADVSRPAEAIAGITRVREKLGSIGVLIHNASDSSGDGLLETTVEQFEQSWRVTALGGFICAKETARDMVASDGGAMIFTGATSSVRGGGWLGFSSAKFALRGLVQSLARELWPQGVHVAHVVVDGLIGTPQDSTKIAPSEPVLDPDRVADAYWHLVNQARSAWTLELDLRPHTEQFFV